MQDTRPSSESVSVDVDALDPDSGLPYISAEPEDPQVARQGDADTHPRIAMPRAPRREEPQPRVVLDEALLRETSTPSGRRDPDTGPAGPGPGPHGFAPCTRFVTGHARALEHRVEHARRHRSPSGARRGPG